MIRPLGKGLMREVSAPAFGHQDTGLAPGGPQDRFSWDCARILLGETAEIQTWEIILSPGFEATEDGIGVCTGGDFERVDLSGRDLQQGSVFRIRKGEKLRFGLRRNGFRTILALRPYTPECEDLLGRERGRFRDVAHWPDPNGVLRVLPGPEIGGLRSLAEFWQAPWVTGLDSSDHGLRLQGGKTGLYQGSMENMVSAPVADGTLQLTPDGLILLLRCRSTIGGYPRIGNLVDPDIDLASQLPSRRRIRFRICDREEARRVLEIRQKDLQRLRKRLINQG